MILHFGESCGEAHHKEYIGTVWTKQNAMEQGMGESGQDCRVLDVIVIVLVLRAQILLCVIFTHSFNFITFKIMLVNVIM